MTTQLTAETDDAPRLAEEASTWLAALAETLAAEDYARLADLFAEDAHWRDMGAFTWDLGVVSGFGAVDKLMRATVGDVRPTGFELAAERTAPRRILRLGKEVVEAYFSFSTVVGYGTGVIRLLETDDGFKGWVLLTRLEGIAGAERYGSGKRPPGVGFDRQNGRTWLEDRAARSSYADHDPEVLVVGGGHHGLFVTEGLQRLGVDVLIVDRFPRVGDNWRTRYETLALHNQTDMIHFPGMPFPQSFPEYLPKGQFANWFEAYVEAMQLNYWTSTEFLGGEFDEATGQWQVRLRLADGTERVMQPRHVIMSTGGVGGRPNIPELPGLGSFSGRVLHTKDFRTAKDHLGERVLVVGVGTSGHDTARDLHLNGVEVAMLQRSPVAIVNIETANRCYPPAYFDGTPLEEADLMSLTSYIFPLFKEGMRQLGAMSRDRDRQTLGDLEKAGLKVDRHEKGWLFKVYENFSGYYINVGCSELIIEGAIQVFQYEEVDTFVANGVRFTDGRVDEFDTIVLATGYLNQRHEVEDFFGTDVAQRVGRIGGFDEVGEMRNLFKPTAQRALWFTGSGIAHGRQLVRHLAAMIKADLEGHVPEHRYGFIAANGGTYT